MRQQPFAVVFGGGVHAASGQRGIVFINPGYRLLCIALLYMRRSGVFRQTRPFVIAIGVRHACRPPQILADIFLPGRPTDARNNLAGDSESVGGI